MTKEEVLKAYGDVKCRFASYYKYSFTFAGVAPDGAQICISIGGNGDDIYRYEVTTMSFETLNGNEYAYASVKNDGKEVWSENRY